MVLQCSAAEESGHWGSERGSGRFGGAVSGNRFGDKSLGFQCGGGGRTNGGDRLGPRVLVELEAAEMQLRGGIVGELLVIVGELLVIVGELPCCCLLLLIAVESADPGLRCMFQTLTNWID